MCEDKASREQLDKRSSFSHLRSVARPEKQNYGRGGIQKETEIIFERTVNFSSSIPTSSRVRLFLPARAAAAETITKRNEQSRPAGF